MTWPFENDTGAIVKKLAKRSLAEKKRRNLMVVVAVALAAFLICFAAVISVSIAQIRRNQVADTYEAVFTGVEASDAAVLKDLPELAQQLRRIVKKESRRPGGIGIPAGHPVRCGQRPAPVPQRFFMGVIMGAAVLLTVAVCWFMVSVSVHRPIKNSCGHLTVGGNAFFHRSGKGTQQKETPETKSHIHGIRKFWARP